MDRYETRIRDRDNGPQCMNLVQGHDRRGRPVYHDVADPRGRRRIRMCRHGEYPQACGQCEREKADDERRNDEHDDGEYVYRDNGRDRGRGRERSRGSRSRLRSRVRGRERPRGRERSRSTFEGWSQSSNSSGWTTYDDYDEWLVALPPARHFGGRRHHDRDDGSQERRAWRRPRDHHGRGDRGWGLGGARHPNAETIQIREKEIEYDDGTSEIRVYAVREGDENRRGGRHGHSHRHHCSVHGFGHGGRSRRRDVERERWQAEEYMNDMKEAARLQRRAAENAEWLNRHYGS